MTPESIKIAVNEAQEFIRRARLVQDICEQDEFGKAYSFISGSKETGALRRQSMELTRALASMRKY